MDPKSADYRVCMTQVSLSLIYSLSVYLTTEYIHGCMFILMYCIVDIFINTYTYGCINGLYCLFVLLLYAHMIIVIDVAFGTG
jgi:hypothetical protein